MKKIGHNILRVVKRNPLYFAICAILCVYLGYWVFMSRALPGWTERGQFGDSFGALNTLFSGAALIGVIFALVIQQRQLSEMRRSFLLQQQPVVDIQPGRFFIDRPRLFTSPNRNGGAVLSRYRCEFTVTNVTDVPAVATVLAAKLSASCGTSINEAIIPCAEHIPLLVKGNPSEASLLFVPEEPYEILFRSLRNKNAFALPVLSVRYVYRNMVGACFEVQQSFHVIPNEAVGDILKSWHSNITSFVVDHQEDFAALASNRGGPDLFDNLQQQLGGLTGEQSSVQLHIVPIHGTFYTSELPLSSYIEFANSVGVPRFTFPDTICPAKDTES